MPLLQLLLLAQIANPRATYDGRQLYFQLGASVHRVIETDEFQPFAEDATNPQVTLGGIQVAFLKPDNGAIVVGGRTFSGPATKLQMSGNGRFLLLDNQFLDLDTNTAQTLPSNPKAVTSDGTVLLEDGNLWRHPPLPFRSTSETSISDNGEVLFYTREVITGLGKFTEHWLYSYHRSSREIQLFYTPDQLGRFPRVLALSADGTTALIMVTTLGGTSGRAVLASSGRKVHSLPDSEPVVDGTLSGDGQMAFLVTESQRLIRLNRFTGEITTLFALQ